jgi:hypothetical protein
MSVQWTSLHVPQSGLGLYGVIGIVVVLLLIAGGVAVLFRRQLMKMCRKKRMRYERVPMEETT